MVAEIPQMRISGRIFLNRLMARFRIRFPAPNFANNAFLEGAKKIHNPLRHFTLIRVDGHFVKEVLNQRVLKTKTADTTIRNYLANTHNTALFQIRLLQKDNQTIIVATMVGYFS